MPDDPSRRDAFDPPLIPESLKQCTTLVRLIEALDERLWTLRQIALSELHCAVTAVNLRGEIRDKQGVELQQLIQQNRRRGRNLGG